MAEIFTNDATDALAAAITAGATSLTVASGTQFPVSGTFRIRIDNEVMTVTAIAGTTWTVTRASEAVSGVQSATAHAAGAAIYGVITAGSLATIAASGGTVTSVAVATANGVSGSVASPSTTPTLTITLGAITPTSVASTGTVTGSNLSGTNTGDQTITLTGDVTGGGTSSFATVVAAHAITYAKMQQTSVGAVLIGNPTGSPANLQEITLGAGLTFSGGVLNTTNSGVGTVTSIQVSGGSTGLTTSGGPVTGSGTITISGLLNPASGGLGADTSGYTLGQVPIAQGGGVYAADSRRGLYSGTGAPAGGLGYPGDYYIDLVSNTLYLKS